MNFKTTAALIFSALSFTSLCVCSDKDLGVAGHNHLRVKHHAQPLAADPTLVEMAKACARDYAARNRIDHKCAKELHKGENLYLSCGYSADPEETIARAIQSFYDEINDYNYNNPGNQKGVVGHVTQLLWNGTTKVGCAVATVGENTAACCLYDPPGNVGNGNPGADYYEFYKENVKKP